MNARVANENYLIIFNNAHFRAAHPRHIAGIYSAFCNLPRCQWVFFSFFFFFFLFFPLYRVSFISGNRAGTPNPRYTCGDYRVFKSHAIFRNAISRSARA